MRLRLSSLRALCSGALVLVAHTLDGSFSLQVILNRWTGEELIPMTSEGCFGQTALMGRRREATYTARTPVRLMLISKEGVEALLEMEPQQARRMCEAVLKDFKRIERIMSLTQRWRITDTTDGHLRGVEVIQRSFRRAVDRAIMKLDSLYQAIQQGSPEAKTSGGQAVKQGSPLAMSSHKDTRRSRHSAFGAGASAASARAHQPVHTERPSPSRASSASVESSKAVAPEHKPGSLPRTKTMPALPRRGSITLMMDVEAQEIQEKAQKQEMQRVLAALEQGLGTRDAIAVQAVKIGELEESMDSMKEMLGQLLSGQQLLQAQLQEQQQLQQQQLLQRQPFPAVAPRSSAASRSFSALVSPRGGKGQIRAEGDRR